MIVLSKMLIAVTIGAGAMLAGAANNTTKAPSNNQAGVVKIPPATWYFEFQGTNGQEDQPEAWKEITASEYDETPCPGNLRGCTLATTAVTTDANGDLRPQNVYVVSDPSNPTINKSPIEKNEVTEVHNRTFNY